MLMKTQKHDGDVYGSVDRRKETDGVMQRADDGGLEDVQGFILNVTISTNADGFVVEK